MVFLNVEIFIFFEIVVVILVEVVFFVVDLIIVCIKTIGVVVLIELLDLLFRDAILRVADSERYVFKTIIFDEKFF